MLDMALSQRHSGSGHQETTDTDSDVTAAVYARTSSISQQFGYSIDEQVRQCVARCSMLDWDVCYVFRDEAESGKDTDRPMFQRMLCLAEQQAFDVLVFWKLDRFSRSIMHAVELENEFKNWGVGLYSVTEHLDTTTPAGQFNFRNLANAAEFERELNKQRTQMGHLARAMEHKWPNASPPFGYDKDQSGYLIINPAEASLVRWIFHTYLVEQSMPSVVSQLKSSGSQTKNGNCWSVNAVSRLLRNEIYIGIFSIGDIHEPAPEYRILSVEDFKQVRAVRNRFTRSEGISREAMKQQEKRSRVHAVTKEYSNWTREHAAELKTSL